MNLKNNRAKRFAARLPAYGRTPGSATEAPNWEIQRLAGTSLRVFVLIALTGLAGCADTEFTPEGAKIQMVTTPQEKAKCDQLKYIEVREPIGMDRMENADRRANNEVAAAGADSLFVISRWFDPVAGAAVFGIALKCH